MRRWIASITAATLLLAAVSGWAIGQMAGGGDEDDVAVFATQVEPVQPAPAATPPVDGEAPATAEGAGSPPEPPATPAGSPDIAAIGRQSFAGWM